MSGRGNALFWAALIGGGALALGALEGHVHAAPNPMGRPDPPEPKGPPEPQPAAGKKKGKGCPCPESDLFLTDDVEALGRVIASEIGSGRREQKIAVAWATRNLARELRKTIAQLVCQPCGKQCGGCRPVSSRLAARRTDVEIAALVMAAPTGEDPTGGATHFINPALQDRLAAVATEGKHAGYRGQTYARVRERWITKYGWEPYYRLGEDLELWGPRKTPQTS